MRFFRRLSRAFVLLEKTLFTLACLVLPVAWGVLVNWLFNLWQGRRASETDDERVFPDYQI